jgi:hypothetical protein
LVCLCNFATCETLKTYFVLFQAVNNSVFKALRIICLFTAASQYLYLIRKIKCTVFILMNTLQGFNINFFLSERSWTFHFKPWRSASFVRKFPVFPEHLKQLSINHLVTFDLIWCAWCLSSLINLSKDNDTSNENQKVRRCS